MRRLLRAYHGWLLATAWTLVITAWALTFVGWPVTLGLVAAGAVAAGLAVWGSELDRKAHR